MVRVSCSLRDFDARAAPISALHGKPNRSLQLPEHLSAVQNLLGHLRATAASPAIYLDL
jgi:hypothetical protein